MDDTNDLDWLSGGGEMGKLIRAMDWSSSALGDVTGWPQSLRTTVSLCLSSTFPINIVWGPEHIQIYNDAYRPICGALHPASMGSRFKECWASALPVVGGAFDRGLQGEGTYIENQQMFLDRYGYLEEAFMTFSFGPVRDESGGVGGIFHPITESTEKMLSARRSQTVRDLANQVNSAKSTAEIFERAIALQPGSSLDLPFLVIYEVMDDGALRSFSSVPSGSALAAPQSWPLDSSDTATVGGVRQLCGAQQVGPYEEAPDNALLMPVFSPGTGQLLFCVVAGISARRALDDEYASFYDMFKNTLATAVTNVRAYEDEQRRAEALARIDKAKTDFFSNVSHEFRTPLTLILGPVDDLLKDTVHPLQPAHTAQFELVQRNAQRLLKLVNSLLDFSRIEANRAQSRFEWLDLARLTADLASVFRSTVEKEGLQLIVDCQPLPQAMLADREMWEKIILNLLSNAFKFTFEGAIGVRTRWLDDGAQGCAEIVIEDSGIGVASEDAQRLFERFYRIQGARSRTYEGTGIGLALVRELVQIHGGTITVDSELGRGTLFRILLPASAADALAASAPASIALEERVPLANPYVQEADSWTERAPLAAAGASGARLVLLADDNHDMRHYVATILQDHWRVLSARDGQEAFELALKHRPDLILSDVMMPVLDGFGLLAKIRAHDDIRSTPVILLSARAGEEAKVEGLNAGADDYLVKPFSARELISRVEALLTMNSVRHEVSAELADNAEKFRAAYANAAVNIAMVDLAGKLLEINQAFLHRSAFALEQLVGRHFATIMHSDDRPACLAAIEDLNSGAQLSVTFDNRHLRADGSFFWVKTNLSAALGADGAPLYLIVISQDIEALKAATARHQAVAVDLEEEKKLREKFVLALAHDLRTPLTVARMGAQLLSRKSADADAVQTTAGRIIRSVDRAETLVRDLLDVNLLKAGVPFPLNIAAHRLDLLVQSAVDGMAGFSRHRIAVRNDAGDVEGYWDAHALQRVCENLLSNAAKYGAPDLPIEVGIRAASISGRPGVEISVHNFGKFIPSTEQKELFTPFHRAPAALESGAAGWGIGLTLVKGITEAHHGQVTLESGERAGTTFRVLLPFDARAA